MALDTTYPSEYLSYMTTNRTATAAKAAGPVALAIVSLVLGVQIATAPAPAEVASAGANVPTYVENLVAVWGCWTGEAPADVEAPGHVIVTRDGSLVAEHAGPAVVADALAQIFDGEDHGLTVHAFCR